MQKISYCIRPFEYVKLNGKCGFYLLVVIDKVGRRLSIEMEFYPKLFDREKDQFRFDGINDEEITDLNLILT